MIHQLQNFSQFQRCFSCWQSGWTCSSLDYVGHNRQYLLVMMDGQIVSTLGDIVEVFGPLCKSHTCTHARTHTRNTSSYFEIVQQNVTVSRSHGTGVVSQRLWRFRFLVPPSGTTCLSTSHLRRHSRFSDNDSRFFCFPVPTKTLSYDIYVTLTIHHYCLDTRGLCNN